MSQSFSEPFECHDDGIEISHDLREEQYSWLNGYSVKNYSTFEEVSPRIRPGDIVSVRKGNGDHFMVYIGLGKCVHFYAAGDHEEKGIVRHFLDVLTQRENKTQDIWVPGVVAIERMEWIIGSGECRIDNRISKMLAMGVTKHNNVPQIARMAESIWKATQEIPYEYNIARFNCEIFALELRYGERIRPYVRTVHKDVVVLNYEMLRRNYAVLYR